MIKKIKKKKPIDVKTYLHTGKKRKNNPHVGLVSSTTDKLDGRTKLAKALKSEVKEELLGQFEGVESLPFSQGESRKIAVKIIDNRGIESFVVKALK